MLGDELNVSLLVRALFISQAFHDTDNHNEVSVPYFNFFQLVNIKDLLDVDSSFSECMNQREFEAEIGDVDSFENLHNSKDLLMVEKSFLNVALNKGMHKSWRLGDRLSEKGKKLLLIFRSSIC